MKCVKSFETALRRWVRLDKGDPATPAADSAADGHPAARTALRRFRRTAQLATAVCISVAACGGTVPSQPGAVDIVPPTAAPQPVLTSEEVAATRSAVGIVGAGGRLDAIGGADDCVDPGAAAGEPIRVGYIGPDLTELATVGFQASVVDDPTLAISAYVNELNRSGGIHGRCVLFDAHHWSLTDPVGTYIDACSHIAGANPLFLFTLLLYDPGLQCTTFGTPIPSIGLFASIPESSIAEGGHLLYADNGSVEHVLARTLEVAMAAGILNESERIGLLHGTGPSAGLGAEAALAAAAVTGTEFAAAADIPHTFGDLSLLLPESQTALLMSDLSEDERDQAQRSLDSQTPEVSARLSEIERFFRDAAAHFRDAGVTVVISASQWSDTRRMMRAAEQIDWTPTWLTSDMQPYTLTTADAPKRQVSNLRQVSASRAAGDIVPTSDQGCITLRNSDADSEPFSHRPHTDAWNLITSVCDYLDVSFGAVTRIGGPIDHLTFISALNETSYEVEYGGLITYSSSDRNGAERFRVLAADPACVLNYWGCMRATTAWLSPVHQMHHEDVGVGDIGEGMNEMGHDHSGGMEMDDTDHAHDPAN